MCNQIGIEVKAARLAINNQAAGLFIRGCLQSSDGKTVIFKLL
ncbi:MULTISPECIES: hypothetical protein [Pseudoalteromonas]|nr:MULTISPECIES: hypothetical protein [Pseudoalteromonas]